MVVEYEKLVATDVVVVDRDVVVEDVLVVVLNVVIVLDNVTPRKLDAKSRLSAAGHILGNVTEMVHAVTVIK